MSRWVRREGRCEVRSLEIACRRAERRVARVSDSLDITIVCTSRAGPLVCLADTGKRASVVVVVLWLPNRYGGIRHSHVHKCQESHELDGVQTRAHLVRDMYRDLVLHPWRCTQARRAIVSPIDTDLSLFLGADRRCHDPVAADGLHVVVGNYRS